MAAVRKLETRPERLWREFIELRDIAVAGGPSDIAAAMAAGRAWSRFLAEFVQDGPAKDAVHAPAVGARR